MSCAMACTPPPATRPGWRAGGAGGPRPTSAPGSRPACWCSTSTRATAARSGWPSSSASTARCRRPGSASRAAATAASTAGSSTPAAGCQPRGWAAAWTSRPTAAMWCCPPAGIPPPASPTAGPSPPWSPPPCRQAGGGCWRRPRSRRRPPGAPASRRPLGVGVWPSRSTSDQLDPGPRPPRLELPRPRPRRRRRPLAPPRRHQPQERHHPPRPAVRLLPRHPLPAHRGRGAAWLQPLPRLRRAGARRGPARRRPSPPGSNPVTAVQVPPIPTAQAVDGAGLLGELHAALHPLCGLPQPPGRRRRHPVDRGHPRPAGLGARPPPGRRLPLEALRQEPPAGCGRRDLPRPAHHRQRHHRRRGPLHRRRPAHPAGR